MVLTFFWLCWLWAVLYLKKKKRIPVAQHAQYLKYSKLMSMNSFYRVLQWGCVSLRIINNPMFICMQHKQKMSPCSCPLTWLTRCTFMDRRALFPAPPRAQTFGLPESEPRSSVRHPPVLLPWWKWQTGIIKPLMLLAPYEVVKPMFCLLCIASARHFNLAVSRLLAAQWFPSFNYLAWD